MTTYQRYILKRLWASGPTDKTRLDPEQQDAVVVLCAEGKVDRSGDVVSVSDRGILYLVQCALSLLVVAGPVRVILIWPAEQQGAA